MASDHSCNYIENSLHIFLLISVFLSEVCCGRHLRASFPSPSHVPNSASSSMGNTRRLNAAELDANVRNFLLSLQKMRLRLLQLRENNVKPTRASAKISSATTVTDGFTTSGMPESDVTMEVPSYLTTSTGSDLIRLTSTEQTTLSSAPATTLKSTTLLSTTVAPRSHHKHRHRHRHRHGHGGHRRGGGGGSHRLAGCEGQVFHDEDSLCTTVCGRCRPHMLLRDYPLCIPHCKQKPRRGRVFLACQTVWYHNYCRRS